MFCIHRRRYTKLTTGFLRSSGIKLVSHPPERQDLTPCEKLRAMKFSTAQKTVNAFKEHVSTVCKETKALYFKKRFEKMAQ